MDNPKQAGASCSLRGKERGMRGAQDVIVVGGGFAGVTAAFFRGIGAADRLSVRDRLEELGLDEES